MLISVAIQCDPPSEAFDSLVHMTWHLNAYSIPFSDRQASPLTSVIGDEITWTCEDGFMLAKNKQTFSYICTQNEIRGEWKPEATNYLPRCPGVFSS